MRAFDPPIAMGVVHSGSSGRASGASCSTRWNRLHLASRVVWAACPAQLKSAILALRANPERRRAYGTRGRELAKNFTSEAMWREYFSLYESLLGPIT